MTMTRRQLLGLAGSACLGSMVPGFSWAQGSAKQRLDIIIQGFSLGIHVPQQIAIRAGLTELGYPPANIKRISSMGVITQSTIGGTGNFSEADVTTSLTASSKGADVRLTGLVYNNLDQVFVVNADKIKSYDDFKKQENVVAINSLGDFIYVFLVGALARHHVDIKDVTLVEMGGSGSRMNALLTGRVAAVPIHFDQAAMVASQGNYKVFVKPWDLYHHFMAESWLTTGSWADKNEQVLVDLNKAMITSFRRANADYDYFAKGYREYATVKGAKEISDEDLKPQWETLSKTIGAWPEDGGFEQAHFETLEPVYREAQVIDGNFNFSNIIDTRYVKQALQELG